MESIRQANDNRNGDDKENDDGTEEIVLEQFAFYHENSGSPLFAAIEESNWKLAFSIAKESPRQVRTWIKSTGTIGTTFVWSVWQRLPIHEACRRQAPAWLVSHLLSVFSESASKPTQFGSLPLHLAVECGAAPEVVNLLIAANVSALQAADQSGRTPLDVLHETELLEYDDQKIVLESLTRATETYQAVRLTHQNELEQVEQEHANELEAMRKQHDDDIRVEHERHSVLRGEADKLTGTILNLTSQLSEQETIINAFHLVEETWKVKNRELEHKFEQTQSDLQQSQQHVHALREVLELKDTEIDTLNISINKLSANFHQCQLAHSSSNKYLIATQLHLEQAFKSFLYARHELETSLKNANGSQSALITGAVAAANLTVDEIESGEEKKANDDPDVYAANDQDAHNEMLNSFTFASDSTVMFGQEEEGLPVHNDCHSIAKSPPIANAMPGDDKEVMYFIQALENDEEKPCDIDGAAVAAAAALGSLIHEGLAAELVSIQEVKLSQSDPSLKLLVQQIRSASCIDDIALLQIAERNEIMDWWMSNSQSDLMHSPADSTQSPKKWRLGSILSRTNLRRALTMNPQPQQDTAPTETDQVLSVVSPSLDECIQPKSTRRLEAEIDEIIEEASMAGVELESAAAEVDDESLPKMLHLYGSTPILDYKCERKEPSSHNTASSTQLSCGPNIMIDLDETTVSELDSVCERPQVVLSSAQHISLSQRDLFAVTGRNSSSCLSLKAPLRRGSLSAAANRIGKGEARTNIQIACDRSFKDASKRDIAGTTTIATNKAASYKSSTGSRVSLPFSTPTSIPTKGRALLRESMKKQQSAPHLPERRDSMQHSSIPVKEGARRSFRQASATDSKPAKSKRMAKQMSVPNMQHGASNYARKRQSFSTLQSQTQPLHSYFQKVGAKHEAAAAATAANDAQTFADVSASDIVWSPASMLKLSQHTFASMSDGESSELQLHSLHTYASMVDATSATTATLGILTPSTYQEKSTVSSLNLPPVPLCDLLQEASPTGDDEQSHAALYESLYGMVFSPGSEASLALRHLEERNSDPDTKLPAATTDSYTTCRRTQVKDNVAAPRSDAVSTQHEESTDIDWAPADGMASEANKGDAAQAAEILWTPAQAEKRSMTAKNVNNNTKSFGELPYLSASTSQLMTSPDKKVRRRKQQSVAASLSGSRNMRRTERGLRKQHSVPTKLTFQEQNEVESISLANNLHVQKNKSNKSEQGQGIQMLLKAGYVRQGFAQSQLLTSDDRISQPAIDPSPAVRKAQTADIRQDKEFPDKKADLNESIGQPRNMRILPRKLHDAQSQYKLSVFNSPGGMTTLASDINSLVQDMTPTLPPSSVLLRAKVNEDPSSLAALLTDCAASIEMNADKEFPSTTSVSLNPLRYVPEPGTLVMHSSTLNLRCSRVEGKVDSSPSWKADRRNSMARSKSAPGLLNDEMTLSTSKTKTIVRLPTGSRRQTLCPAELQPMLVDNSLIPNRLRRQKSVCSADIDPMSKKAAAHESSGKKPKAKRIKMKASDLGLSSTEMNPAIVQHAWKKWTAHQNRAEMKEASVFFEGNSTEVKKSRGRSTGNRSLNPGKQLNPSANMSKSSGRSDSSNGGRKDNTLDPPRGIEKDKIRSPDKQNNGYQEGMETSVKSVRKSRSKSRRSIDKRTSQVDHSNGTTTSSPPPHSESKVQDDGHTGSSSDFSYDFVGSRMRKSTTSSNYAKDDRGGLQLSRGSCSHDISGSHMDLTAEVTNLSPIKDLPRLMRHFESTSAKAAMVTPSKTDNQHESSTNLGSTSDSLSTPVARPPEAKTRTKTYRVGVKELMIPLYEDYRHVPERTVSEITEDPMFRKVALAGITEDQLTRLHKLGLKITES
ncbi:hypothetical protein MPSEU_000415900 [Mayamaea pseudoterrestris]|nr:hypothetical protein MPSEU_000415900 [Mayamaea pseudoterrestris]